MEQEDKNQLGQIGLSEEHIRLLYGMLPEYKAEAKELWKVLAHLPEEEWAKHIPKDFSWASVYELSMFQHMLLMLASLGVLSVIVEAVRESSTPVDDFMRALQEFEPRDPTDGSWQGGDGGLFEFHDVMGLLISAAKQVESAGTFGKYLSEFTA